MNLRVFNRLRPNSLPCFGTLSCLGLLAVSSVLSFAASPAAAEDADQSAGPSDAPSETWDVSQAVAFVKSHCLDCHTGDGAESGLNLASFDGPSDVAESIEAWNKIVTRVQEGQMPPEDAPSPPVSDRQAFVRWVRQTIHQAVCDDGVTPGRPMLRRLNKTEYANTVRDLLGIPINAGHALPADGAGGEGFDNAAETLFVSPVYAEKYLDAARSALGHAMKDPRDRQKILVATPSENRTPEQAAHEVLAKFLRRAFRRPVSDSEIEQYLGLFRAAFDEEPSYTSAIQFTLEAAMVSPKFLFLMETPGDGTQMTTLNDHELACRLSYFLWASMPDDELMRLADAGKLSDEAVLEKQIERMLESPTRRGLRVGSKVRGFATSFIEQWLGTRALGREFKPDASVSNAYDSELEGGMKYEPIFFFEDLLAENRSLLNFIDSDFTYVNRRLARHYKVDGKFREQPKFVELPDDSARGGLLGMSAVLAVSSFPHRTSPVLRGKWILETLLGTPPPPAPPNVPALDESTDAAKPATLRQKLELHRADPTCASCHSLMDPLGFGLENYDVLGRWRTTVDGAPIDASGVLPGGVTFDGPEELKRLLMERKDQFVRNLTAKTLGYALGRGLTNEDRCVVEQIVVRLREDDYRAQTLIKEIAKSVPFRYKQGRL